MMRFWPNWAARLARIRLGRNLPQDQLAEQAGVSKRTVERLEAGAVTQLSGFIRVCRALGVLERFETLVSEPVPSPIEQLKLRGRRRQRASSTKVVKSPSKKWQWEDKQRPPQDYSSVTNGNSG